MEIMTVKFAVNTLETIKRRPSSDAASAGWHKNWSKGQHLLGAPQYRGGEPAASAAPLPDIPLLRVDELPPPLLDCGQGKISSTKGVDGGERGTDDWLQVTVSGDREQLEKFWTSDEDMTAIRDCIPASNAFRLLNSIDLPQSETTPTPSSVVPPLGENLMVNADTTVNGVHPPLERSSARARKGVADMMVNGVHPPLKQSSARARKGVADTTVNGVHPPLERSSARARKRVRW